MAYTMGYRTLKKHGDAGRAVKCLEWAAAYAKGIINMQRPDGGLHERYRFGTFTPCSPAVFPTPMALGLTEYIRALEEEKVSFIGVTPDRLRKVIVDQIRYARSLPSDKSIKMLAGSEAGANSSNWFICFSEGRMLTRYALPDDLRDDEKLAMDAAKLSTYLCAFYPEAPQFYLIQACNCVAQNISVPLVDRIGENVTCDGVPLMSKGDMDDFQQASMGLALLRHCNDDVGLILARYALAARLSTSILESGAVCECEIDVPGYYFKQTEYTFADVNAATLGVALFQYVTGTAMI
jgi:hypothetical protein